MFFNDGSKPSVIRVKLLYPQFDECMGRRRLPPTSWTGSEASGDTAGMLGYDIAFDHQPEPSIFIANGVAL